MVSWNRPNDEDPGNAKGQPRSWRLTYRDRRQRCDDFWFYVLLAVFGLGSLVIGYYFVIWLEQLMATGG